MRGHAIVITGNAIIPESPLPPTPPRRMRCPASTAITGNKGYPLPPPSPHSTSPPPPPGSLPLSLQYLARLWYASPLVSSTPESRHRGLLPRPTAEWAYHLHALIAGMARPPSRIISFRSDARHSHCSVLGRITTQNAR